MLRTLLAVALLFVAQTALMAQESDATAPRWKQAGDAQKITLKATKIGTVVPGKEASFDPVLQNLEAPKPNSGTTRAHLREIKREVAKRFPKGGGSNKYDDGSSVFGNADTLTIGRAFEGNVFNGSVPNDNTMAISNGGQLLSCINSTVYAFDVEGDSLLFSQSLAQFALPLLIAGSKYDPKAIYDPINDRFILVFLNGTTPTVSRIIFGFSSTNDLRDPWNLFSVSGDPVADSTWTDYPAVCLTEQELFITGNQIIPGEPWQTGFSQSIIWQIDKQSAFAGDTVLDATLWTGINCCGREIENERSIRNLNPVKGGSQPYGPNAYFISNRNFDIENDTVFMVEINDVAENASLRTFYGITDTPYGVPPEAEQQGSHTFDTNDGRWLGAFLENDKIQFVGNSVNPETGLASVYHGFISDLDAAHPTVTGTIIGDTSTDSIHFGYPNIVYVGESGCDDESVIIFEHSADSVFAGYSAVYHGNHGEYSARKIVKEGDNYVDVLLGGYERWGDYTGIQRKYNEPGKVWAAANYGRSNKRNGTWIAELMVGDSVDPLLYTNPVVADASSFNQTDGSVQIDVSGGYEPVTFKWSDAAAQTTSSASGLAAGSYILTITDASDCKLEIPVQVAEPEPVSAFFPNPVSDRLFVQFEVPADTQIDCAIYDMRGAVIKYVYSGTVKSGNNLFSFDTLPLAKGTYVFKVTSADGDILTEKLVKE